MNVVEHQAKPAAIPALLGAVRVPAPQDRKFWIGLACAGLVHLLIIFATLADRGKRLGEPDASPDGVSVLIVDAADLQSRTTVPSEPPASPPPQPPPQPKAAPTPPAQKPEEQQQPVEREQASAAPPTPQPADPDAPGDAQPPAQQRQQKPSRQAAARPANPAPPTRPTLNLNLDSMPSYMTRGGSFAPTRPPGITRSGENDEFGRGVIRALQRTVPQLVNTVGRVLVRITINPKGNLASVEVLRPSGVAGIDQSVIFAAKQSSFPIPPDNSTEVDRTFLITYIFTVY